MFYTRVLLFQAACRHRNIKPQINSKFILEKVCTLDVSP